MIWILIFHVKEFRLSDSKPQRFWTLRFFVIKSSGLSNTIQVMITLIFPLTEVWNRRIRVRDVLEFSYSKSQRSWTFRYTQRFYILINQVTEGTEVLRFHILRYYGSVLRERDLLRLWTQRKYSVKVLDPNTQLHIPGLIYMYIYFWPIC